MVGGAATIVSGVVMIVVGALGEIPSGGTITAIERLSLTLRGLTSNGKDGNWKRDISFETSLRMYSTL